MSAQLAGHTELVSSKHCNNSSRSSSLSAEAGNATRSSSVGSETGVAELDNSGEAIIS